MIMIPILYIVLLCLCLNSIITNPEFIIFSIIVLYSLNFIILITATNDIYRKNDVDRYYAYYKCNEED